MSFNLGRWREFGLGLVLGLSLSLFVLVWQNYREKNAAHVVAEVPRPEPRPDKGAGDVEDNAKNYDFYDMLPNFEVVVPEKDREVSRERENGPASTCCRPARTASRKKPTASAHN